MEAKQGVYAPPGQKAPTPDPTPRWTTTAPYTELLSSQIRLLRILPFVDRRETKIICTLSVHDLLNAPAYTALSYTWGVPHREIRKLRRTPPSSTHCIDCNGREAHVGENLYDFLLQCAHDTSGDLHGYLWIDALSIDQGNTQERSEQVKLMGDIYRNADTVFVWLGTEDDSTIQAMDLIKGLLRLGKSGRLNLHPSEVNDEHPNSLLTSGNWQALFQFFRREWFNRAWIIQEVVFAKSITLFCSKHLISWRDLCEISGFLATSSWTVLLRGLGGADYDQRSITMGHNMPARISAAQRTCHSEHDDKFLYALIRARSSNSGDPRDKVYSQIGLGDAQLIPDYRATVVEVYTTAAEYILKHCGNLLLLTCVEGEEFQEVPNLPSWVPDWSVSAHLGLRKTGYRDFQAAGQLHKRYELTKHHDGIPILAIHATQLDEIVDISETKSEVRNNPYASRFWAMISQLDSNYAPVPGQSVEEAVWRALMTNRQHTSAKSNPSGPQYPAQPNLLEPSFRAWVLWRYAATLGVSQTITYPPSCSYLLPSNAEIQEAIDKSIKDPGYLKDLKHRASLYDVHYSHAMLLCPFITRCGYFGIGTQCLRKADTIWIVPGCPVPLILRRVEGSEHCRLVGGAYVHGFMNGEILQRKNLEFEMVHLE
ncbi:HET-domain-containing protein [Ophiobolus disseminans]|uniref:HET-domain-containing protein n=1 Tax=Ophiobolus disseminans TaxID=1469910 RepID=A0A6A7ADN9_9PLEO|nr:HET-domain-containing protein [Ophiobolus disseminans]